MIEAIWIMVGVIIGAALGFVVGHDARRSGRTEAQLAHGITLLRHGRSMLAHGHELALRGNAGPALVADLEKSIALVDRTLALVGEP
jgi:hypothetical protein